MTEIDSKAKAAAFELLRKPFPPEHVGLLPKPAKNSSKGNCNVCGGYHGLPAVHVDYVGHGAVTLRLLDADPEWNWEPLAVDESGLPVFDLEQGVPVGLWIQLTVLGITRIEYGHQAPAAYRSYGDQVKAVISDAISRAAMRFGVATYLWIKPPVPSRDDNDSEKPPMQDKQSPPPSAADRFKQRDLTSQVTVESLINDGKRDQAEAMIKEHHRNVEGEEIDSRKQAELVRVGEANGWKKPEIGAEVRRILGCEPQEISYKSFPLVLGYFSVQPESAEKDEKASWTEVWSKVKDQYGKDAYETTEDGELSLQILAAKVHWNEPDVVIVLEDHLCMKPEDLPKDEQLLLHRMIVKAFKLFTPRDIPNL